MRNGLLIAILLVAASCLCSPVSTAQETRALIVSVDSVRLNVCGAKNFRTAIRVASVSAADTVIGFRASDNVASATLYVTWDPSTIDLNDFVFVSGTMAQPIKTVVRKFHSESTLEIIIADDREPFGFLRGQLPLLFLSGTVTAPDTVDGMNGWIQVTDVELTSETRFTPEYSIPGFVHVVRDTTPEYTGTLAVSPASFDTLRLDTVMVTLANVRSRRVNEVEFVLAADSEFFGFVDTLEVGTLSATIPWSQVEVEIAIDTVRGRFVAPTELSQEGPLLGIVLRRATDSAFSTEVEVVSAAVNSGSCLGRFYGVGASVTAAAVPDTTTTSVPVRDPIERPEVTLIPNALDGTVLIRSGGRVFDEVRVADALGRPVDASVGLLGGDGGLIIQLDPAIASGSYLVLLRNGREQVSKQFIFIK